LPEMLPSGPVSPPSARARPKSTTLTRPSRPTRMLAGFRSRWVIFLVCAASSALATCPVFECRIEREWPFELLALDVFHHQVVRTDVVDLADVRMIQLGDGFGFAFKAFAEGGLGDFDGYDAVQARIAGAVDLAHAARADGGEDFVGAEFVAWGKVH